MKVMRSQCTCSYCSASQSGASIPPEAMMHFPLFQISPLFSKKFLTFWKISEILPFPDKISYFRPKFPIFVRQNLLFPPTFQNFPPVLEKFNCFLHTLCVFRFPPTFTMMHLCITQCTYSNTDCTRG